MLRCVAVIVILLELATTAPVVAQSQLALSAGLTDEHAQGLAFHEIATVKFNRDLSTQDQTLVRDPGAVTEIAFQEPIDLSRHYQLIRISGLTPEQAEGLTFHEIATVKFNRDLSTQDQTLVRGPGAVTEMALQDSVDVSSHYQLIRTAGFTPEQAEGMTLNQIARVIDPD
jgi:hypothetical protein